MMNDGHHGKTHNEKTCDPFATTTVIPFWDGSTVFFTFSEGLFAARQTIPRPVATQRTSTTTCSMYSDVPFWGPIAGQLAFGNKRNDTLSMIGFCVRLLL
jgi:hypothetical protein